MSRQATRISPRVVASLSVGDTKDRKLDRGLLLRVWDFSRNHHRRIYLYVGLLTVGTGFAVLPPLVLRQIIDTALPGRNRALLHLLVVAAVAVAVLDTLMSVASRYLSASIGEGIIYDLRVALYEKLSMMPVAFFTKAQSGAIMSRFSTDVVGAQSVVTTVTAVASESLLLLATLGVMVSLSWQATLLALLIMPVAVAVDRWAGRRVVPLSRERLRANASMNATTSEHLNVSGAWVSKLYGDLRRETEEFAKKAADVAKYGIATAMVMRAYNAALSLLGALGTVFVYWIGGLLVLRNSLSLGTLVALGLYAQRLYAPISVLASARVDLLSALVAFERCFEVLDAEVPIKDAEDAVPLRITEGKVVFENVWFRYPPKDVHYIPSLEQSSIEPEAGYSEGKLVYQTDRAVGQAGRERLEAGVASKLEEEAKLPDEDGASWVLEGVNFVAEPGKVTAIVGATGSGKSTLLSLVPRLYDPDKGAVTIDGQDIRKVTLASLRREIGMVTQETFLFHDTLEANLRYANPEATDEELRKACEIAGILDFIETLPDGFQTVVGERGYRLSGGEKQRIAIARMLLKDPKIVLLDEPTAHLDVDTEEAVRAALSRALEGRTAIVVSHRESFVAKADKIYEMSNGRLIELENQAENLIQSTSSGRTS